MSQSIINGLSGLRPILAGKRFLLVRDSAYDYLDVKAFFDEFPHAEFSGFTPNPLYEQVAEGVQIFRACEAEIIVAVGGGSAIDVAKCIKLFCRMEDSVNYLTQPQADTGVLLIALPTTAGTGSESTRHAVIYYQGAKQSISHTSIVPDYAVLEPSVLKTLPVYQKKCTMMDALSQTIESWWSVNSNEESRNFSAQAIRAIMDNWEAYIFRNEQQAAAAILAAANAAGQAINITATTAAHAMSYKLTSMYCLPHGHAVALCLPEVWEYMLAHPEHCIDARGQAHLTNTLADIARLIDLPTYRSMIARMELTYPQADDREAELSMLAASVNPVRLKNNPVALSEAVLRSMYERILKA